MFGSGSGSRPNRNPNRNRKPYLVPSFRFGTAKPELEKPETGKPEKPNRKNSGAFRFLNRYSPVPFSGSEVCRFSASGGVFGACFWCGLVFLARLPRSGAVVGSVGAPARFFALLVVIRDSAGTGPSQAGTGKYRFRNRKNRNRTDTVLSVRIWFLEFRFEGSNRN